MINKAYKQMGVILNIIGEELDISPSSYEDARKKYHAVAEYLAEPDTTVAQYDPNLYSQGSLRLGTVVKPLGSNEFDLDLVCEMNISSTSDQQVVKELVGNRFKEKEIYKKMLKPKNRCWRLDYAGAFHMDVLPAIPDGIKGNDCILVPDRKLCEWQPSNPRGYANWFKERMLSIRRSLIEKKAIIEEIPLGDPSIRTPLQRSVQLLKRHRDILFQDDAENAPISVVITTLAAKAYNNEEDLYEALINIIRGIPSQLDSVDGWPAVLNPMNREENFAEKWMEFVTAGLKCTTKPV